MEQIIKCLKCNSKEIVKEGMRKNKTQEIQKYRCKKCDKYFISKENIIENKTYTPNIITQAISLYNLGNSLKETSQIINIIQI